jgi:hypothetical protein
VSVGALFFWGAIGALCGEVIDASALLQSAVRGDLRLTITPARVLGFGSIVIVYCALGGTLSWLVLDHIRDSSATVAIVVGYAGASVVPRLIKPVDVPPGTIDGADAVGRRTKSRDEAGAPVSQVTSRPPSRVAKGVRWWTSDRVRTLFTVGIFVVALLTYLAAR